MAPRDLGPGDELVSFMRAPPHSVEAEQSVLGALLLDNAAWDRIEGKLAPTDFYLGWHRVIFEGQAAMIRGGQPCDVVTLSAAMAAAGTLEAAGGVTYLGELLRQVPTASRVEHYAGIVRDRAIRREVLAAGIAAQELAYEVGGRAGAEILAEASARFAAIGDAQAGEIGRLGDFVAGAVEAMDKRATAGVLPGLSTGLKDLDGKLLGLRPGDLVVVAGRPSHGKTTLGMGCAVTAAQFGAPALVFSLEMRPRALVERAIAYVGRVNAHAMRAGLLQPEDWEQIAHAAGKIYDLPLYVDGSPRLTVDAIRARARKLHRKVGLRLIMVDYLQLMDASGDNRNEQVASISRGLKLLANELEVPVIALSQLSRRCEERTDKRPMLSDLRDSGAVEQDADIVIFVYRDELYKRTGENEGKAELIIAKQREGETGRVFATFMGQFNRFGDTEWAPSLEPAKLRRGRDINGDDDN